MAWSADPLQADRQASLRATVVIPPLPPPPSLLSEHHSAFLAGESSSDGFQLCIDGVVMQLQMWLWCITLSRLGVQISIRKTLF